MLTRTTIASALLAALAGWTAQPAEPSGGAAPPPAPAYGANITLAQAKKVLAAAEAEAAKMHAEGAVFAVVQPSGALVLFEKLDGSTYVSIDIAQAKARTAAITRRTTGWSPPGGPPLPSLIGLPGGVPIVVNGRTVGAIGVSGVEGGGDSAIAQAGASALEGGGGT
ncbi:MAG TPA: heme-binding protein [Steroidobacteraceae bacterium]|nr:heme-binding protein [Steroidobacteraceae bacterium]